MERTYRVSNGYTEEARGLKSIDEAIQFCNDWVNEKYSNLNPKMTFSSVNDEGNIAVVVFKYYTLYNEVFVIEAE